MRIQKRRKSKFQSKHSNLNRQWNNWSKKNKRHRMKNLRTKIRKKLKWMMSKKKSKINLLGRITYIKLSNNCWNLVEVTKMIWMIRLSHLFIRRKVYRNLVTRMKCFSQDCLINRWVLKWRWSMKKLQVTLHNSLSQSKQTSHIWTMIKSKSFS